MILLDIGDTLQSVAAVISLLAPIAFLVLALLLRKGWISKNQKEGAEKVIHVLTNSIDAFKKENKAASKSLTELVAAKATGAKVEAELDSYLRRFDLNR